MTKHVINVSFLLKTIMWDGMSALGKKDELVKVLLTDIYLEEERSKRDFWKFHNHHQQTVDRAALDLTGLLQISL